jgi:hypothetical protein
MADRTVKRCGLVWVRNWVSMVLMGNLEPERCGKKKDTPCVTKKIRRLATNQDQSNKYTTTLWHKTRLLLHNVCLEPP